MLLQWGQGGVVFVLGLIIGSFLNVCILRLPLKLSIATPSSHCCNCQRPIKWYDNIPLISFLILKGKCRYCHAIISWQYPLVELLNGLFFVLLWLKFGFSPLFFINAALTSVLITTSVIDLHHKRVLDKITLPGMVIGLGLALSSLLSVPLLSVSLKESLWGFLAGGGILYIAAIASRGGMGGGDIKLMAMLGLFLGWQKTLLTIFIAVFLGSVVGVTFILCRQKGRKDLIPFAPYLALGAIISIFIGNNIIHWYLTAL